MATGTKVCCKAQSSGRKYFILSDRCGYADAHHGRSLNDCFLMLTSHSLEIADGLFLAELRHSRKAELDPDGRICILKQDNLKLIHTAHLTTRIAQMVLSRVER